MNEVGIQKQTRQLPWIKLVDIDIGDDGNWEGRGRHLLAQVVKNELLICWVETKAWGESGLRVVHGCR